MSEPVEQADREPPLGRRVGSGLSWIMALAPLGKVFGVSQVVVLGFLLDERDYGLFGLALGVFGFTLALRDGGIRSLLLHRGRELDSLIGPGFWLGLASNGVASILVIALAWFYGRYTSEPSLMPLVALMTLSLLVSPARNVASAVMSWDMRFREQAMIDLGMSAVRCTCLIVAASAGLGAFSFGLGLVFAMSFSAAMHLKCARIRPWRRSPRFAIWPGLLGQAVWLIAGAGALGLQRQGDYFAAGFFVDTRVIGIYYFAYALLDQMQGLIGAPVQKVMVPSFARLTGEPQRMARAYERSVVALVFLCAPATVLVGLLADPLIKLIWAERWLAAIPVVQILALLYFPKILFSLPFSMQQASGRFRSWALTCAVLGVAAVSAAALGAGWLGSAEGIALLVGLALLLAGILVTVLAVPESPRARAVLVFRILAPWVASLAAAGTAYLLGAGVQWPDGRIGRLMELIALGALFSAGYGIIALLCLRDTLSELVGLLPARVRRRLPLEFARRR